MTEKDKPKQPVQKLDVIDTYGRITCTSIVHNLDAMILKSFPELKDEYEKIQAKKKKGKVLPFPK